ncbi:SURF1 family protein [Leifsonia sp. H3M29-4]|uniref:SURF1 family cytochrome oxidase biogenesis protein n=1 Tax=Salinibacterium metalliresistens TaxID=3031321 RepID=UPI0023DA174C|nr:SURF1 family protein [Salinibacterium metalliresistens]MDF1479891.1 SURF1 family protein [Salinibacterium metalliresistens]
MKGWGFAFSRRWLGYLGLVVVFAIACVFLSMWQLARSEEAREAVERVETNWSAAPVDVASVLPALDAFDPDDTWQPVALQGRYLADQQLLVRGRPFEGHAGFEVLVPFELTDGTVFVVDRGWVPVGNSQDLPDAVPAPPAGETSIVVRLKAGEPTIPGRSAPEGQLATINLPTVADLVAEPTYTGAYGLLASEDPAPPSRPAAYPRPVADGGPHLSYAFQWVAFGVLAFIGLGWAVRHEYRVRNEDDPEERRRAQSRRAKAAAKGPTDAEIEDAILDRR